MNKPSVAVHKFSSCDGCQLAFLNAGEDLLTLSELVDIRHFAEAGPVHEQASVDIAFVEGSVATPDDVERLQTIRTNSNYLVTIGACATSGGLQALRNMADAQQWIEGVYAHPEYIRSLDTSTPIREHVKVDLELWGCPVNGRQVLAAVRALLFGVVPVEENDKVCLECKRQQNVCVLVAKGEPCMGPVTRTGCGALCPAFGRDCYACYGPAENANTAAMAQRLQGLGLVDAAIAQRFLFIHSDVEPFNKEGQNWKPVS
jgi:coenzyme F420-reducing hydrogenase gamma subunit